MKQIIPFVKDLELGTKIAEITSIALEHNLQMENDDSIVGDFIVSGKYKINDISINEEVFEKVLPFDITLDDKYDASKVQIDIDDFYYEIINEEFLRVHIDVLTDNLVYIKKEVEKPAEIIKEEPEEILRVESEENNVVITEQSKILERNNGDMMEKEDLEKEREGRCIVKDSEEKDGLEEKINFNSFMNENEIEITDEDESKEVGRESLNIANNLPSSFLDSEEKYITYKVHIVRETETIEQIKEKYNITMEELEKYNNLDNIVLGTKIIIPVNNE